MSFPTTPPAGTDPRPWDFPPTARLVLPGGPTLLAVRQAALPMVHVRWSFRRGRTEEPAEIAGACSLLSAVARHGTERFDSEGLAQALDHLGARLRVAVSADSFVVGVTALSEHLDQALAITHEVALRPTVPEADLERERDKAMELHRHQLSQPEQLGGLWFSRAVYGAHPYGRPATTVAGLQAVTRQQVVDLHRLLADTSDGLLLVVGDIDPDTVLARLRDSGLPTRTRSPLPEPRPARPQARRLFAVHRPGSEQASISLGHMTFARNHPDHLPLRVANQVLGAGASSRLFMELRERRSLTYGAYSALDAGRLGGDLSASLSCAPAKATEAVSALLDELRRLHTEPPAPGELEEARRYIVGSFPRKASGVAGVAALVENLWQYDLPPDTWNRYQADVAAVVAEEVQRAASLWVRPDDASIVVVGPPGVVEAALEAHGEVEVRDVQDRAFEVEEPWMD